jgi:hypothetical protein
MLRKSSGTPAVPKTSALLGERLPQQTRAEHDAGEDLAHHLRLVEPREHAAQQRGEEQQECEPCEELSQLCRCQRASPFFDARRLHGDPPPREIQEMQPERSGMRFV